MNEKGRRTQKVRTGQKGEDKGEREGRWRFIDYGNQVALKQTLTHTPLNEMKRSTLRAGRAEIREKTSATEGDGEPKKRCSSLIVTEGNVQSQRKVSLFSEQPSSGLAVGAPFNSARRQFQFLGRESRGKWKLCSFDPSPSRPSLSPLSTILRYPS